MSNYDIFGNFIFPDFEMNHYIIHFKDNNNSVEVNTLLDLIRLVDLLTKYKNIDIYDEYGKHVVIFRKHIVKITEVK